MKVKFTWRRADSGEVYRSSRSTAWISGIVAFVLLVLAAVEEMRGRTAAAVVAMALSGLHLIASASWFWRIKRAKRRRDPVELFSRRS